MRKEGDHHSVGRGRYFVAGLVAIVPLGVTIIVLTFLVNLLAKFGKLPASWISNLLNDWLVEEFGWDIRILESAYLNNAMAVVIVIVLVYVLGVMTSNFIGRWFLGLFERIMENIPIVKSIYGAVKKLMSMMRQDTGEDIQRVVLIEFPSPEMKTVGFVTRTFEDSDTGRKLATVYVPTTPNPTSGYLEIVPIDRIVSTNWTFDEAMQFIVSGGAVAPESMNYEKSVGRINGIQAEGSEAHQA